MAAARARQCPCTHARALTTTAIPLLPPRAVRRCEQLNCVDFTDGFCDSHTDRNEPFNM